MRPLPSQGVFSSLELHPAPIGLAEGARLPISLDSAASMRHYTPIGYKLASSWEATFVGGNPMLDSDAQEQVALRLRRIAGQMRGLERMVGESRLCVDFLTQISAV
jgi:hypothetical protein